MDFQRGILDKYLCIVKSSLRYTIANLTRQNPWLWLWTKQWKLKFTSPTISPGTATVKWFLVMDYRGQAQCTLTVHYAWPLQATGAILPTLFALHLWHQMARSPEESQPAQHRVHLWLQVQLCWAATSQGWNTYTCVKQSSSASSKKESEMVVLQESVTKISWKDSLHRRDQPSVMAAGGLRQRQLAFITMKTVGHETTRTVF